MSQPEPRKKIREMTSDERRAYNKESKRRQRDKERAGRLAVRIPIANEYEMPTSDQQAIFEHGESVLRSVQAEVSVTKTDQEIVESIASVQFGFENDLVQKVVGPTGMLVGGYFPEAVAHRAIEHVHRFPNILQSRTFRVMYDKVLQQVVRWAEAKITYASQEYIADVKSELAGKYVLPTLP